MTKNKLPFSNQFERGHSFNWAGKWTEGKYYMNDAYVTDFVAYGTCILACRKSHLATSDLKPSLIYDSKGFPVDVDSPYWEFVVCAMNQDIMVVLTKEEYDDLVEEGTVQEDTFYFIKEDD